MLNVPTVIMSLSTDLMKFHLGSVNAMFTRLKAVSLLNLMARASNACLVSMLSPVELVFQTQVLLSSHFIVPNMLIVRIKNNWNVFNVNQDSVLLLIKVIVSSTINHVVKKAAISTNYPNHSTKKPVAAISPVTQKDTYSLSRLFSRLIC